jgi:hypothetical protein
VNEVTDVPKAFKSWVEEHKEGIRKAEKRGTLPYFVVDNKEYANFSLRSAGIFNSTYPTTHVAKLEPTQILDLSNISKTLKAKLSKKDINAYFARGFIGIEPAPVGEKYYMSTDINGKIFVNFAVDENKFDAGTSLVSAFEKLKNGQPLTGSEEYSIEILWHEILHNKTKNTVILPSIETVDVGFKRAVAETVNQLIARHTYPEFLTKIGGTAQHQKWVLENGYGYEETVANMRSLISALNMEESDFVSRANELLMEDYTDFDVKIRELFQEMSKRKDLWTVEWIYNRIEFREKRFSQLLNSLKILNK